MPPAEDTFMMNCGLCGRAFQYGPHRYEGKHIPRYQLTVCEPCWQGNWDGWAPHLEAQIIEHLQARGLPIPPRNENGWLPRE